MMRTSTITTSSTRCSTASANSKTSFRNKSRKKKNSKNQKNKKRNLSLATTSTGKRTPALTINSISTNLLKIWSEEQLSPSFVSLLSITWLVPSLYAHSINKFLIHNGSLCQPTYLNFHLILIHVFIYLLHTHFNYFINAIKYNLKTFRSFKTFDS